VSCQARGQGLQDGKYQAGEGRCRKHRLYFSDCSSTLLSERLESWFASKHKRTSEKKKNF
jgi:hypothetical protein